MTEAAMREQILETAIEAARQAGRVIAGRYPAGRDASLKGYRDLVTETDVAAEAAILDLVRDRFPNHATLSEESEGGGIGEDYTWVVDPLDGTSNFTHRVPIFAVSIGVLEQGEPLIGVVYDPMREHLFGGERGGGATLNGRPMRVSRAAGLHEAIVGFDWARNDEMREQVLDAVQRIAPRCHTVRVLGSAALGLTYVAAGWLDAYFHLALHPWDAAGGVLLIEETGGLCTTLEGDTFRVEAPGCVATNGLVHEELLAVMRET